MHTAAVAHAPSSPRLVVALLLLAGALATVLAALGFEHVGGYLPCALCLLEREPYYAAIPAAAAAAYGVWARAPGCFTPAMFLAVAALMLYGGVLGAYHAGVEWDFWEGPAACAGGAGLPGSPGAMRDALLGGTVAPSCDAAVWDFAGLSFAGWNVVISAALFGLALFGLGRRA